MGGVEWVRARVLLLAMISACTGQGELETVPVGGGPPGRGGVSPDPGITLPLPGGARCAPGPGGTHWVLEAQPVTIEVGCTAAALQTPSFAVAQLPRGATFDAATATLQWTPGIDQAALWSLTVIEQTTGERGVLQIGVVENERAGPDAPIVDPAAYPEEYGLPVFHLSNDAPLELEAYRPARLVYRGRTYELEAKVRGQSSTEFPKRSLTLKFRDGQLFDEPVFGDGFHQRKRLVLVTTFNDNSYLRSRLAFDLWARLSPEHIRLRSFSAVVYQNNRYVGLYTVVDHVDQQLLGAHGLSRSAELFKATGHDANFSRLRDDGTPKVSLSEDLEKKEGEPPEGAPGAYASIADLFGFVHDTSGAAFRTGYGQRMNTRDYEDWWIFNTLIVGDDSANKNAYHAHDPSTGGPWRYIPWDLDATLGQEYDTRRSSPRARPTYAGENALFGRLLLDPVISGRMRERYRQVLEGELRVANVQAMIDRYVQETAPSARRDWERWRGAYRTFGRAGTPGDHLFLKWSQRTDFNEYEGEVAYVRGWVTERWQFLLRDGVP